MKFRFILLLLTIVSGNALAFQSSIEIIEQFDEVKLVAFINQNDIENYPLWHSLTEAPPLSISEAIQAVKKLYKSHNDKLGTEAVREIELRVMPHHKKYWHYLIKMKGDDNGKQKYQVYVVLMNGKVIPAIMETESYK